MGLAKAMKQCSKEIVKGVWYWYDPPFDQSHYVLALETLIAGLKQATDPKVEDVDYNE